MDASKLEVDALKHLQSNCQIYPLHSNFDALCKLAIIFIGYVIASMINDKMKLRR